MATPPVVSDLSGFLQRVSECNNVSSKRKYVPFKVDNQVIGYLQPRFLERLLVAEDTFQASEDQSIALAAHLHTPQQRTTAVAGVLERLRDEGHITGWRNEMYPVVPAFHDAPLLLMERAAAVCFGIKAYGVHVNGYVNTPSGIKLWVARRSKKKPTWPGKLDHLVAGGQPHGLSCAENVIKECGEEASIPEDLARTAIPAGAVSYEYEQSLGLKRDVLFVYDLELPADFVPTPQDGEVEEFMLLPIEEVARIISR
ncbi:hypothetical protein WJX72_008059 [[Myrmecia] bisecta]|uniref:Nudix hydrolase domain-containing protein n=1 Tax=[Myrmecia] bisecta TaxID=41462 RepID=A0AAW1QG66_9CHLO